MKRAFVGLLAAGILVISGCYEKSPPGGPGVARTNNTNPVVGTPDDTFRISVPPADLKQGETKTVAIGISRGTNFDQDVRLGIADAPQGVAIKFAEPLLRASDKEAHVTIEATKDAALGEHKVKLTATPTRSGDPTSADLKIEVKKP